MATVSGSELAVADWEHGSDSRSDRYLSARLAAAGSDFKGVAVATFALAAAVAVLAWLAVGVLVEHWLVPGGLPGAVRWVWFVTGVAGLVAAAIRWVVPLVRYRVNLVYAARVIEHEHPELHNDLVNAVLVKARPDSSTPRVVRSLERRAAKRLSMVPDDGVADRIVPLRLAVVLAAIVTALCAYQLFAPKSLVVSAARLVAPWWRLDAPARVSIAPLRLSWRLPPDGTGANRPDQPLEAVGGAVTLVRGRQLVVETDVHGLREDERAGLFVTPVREAGAGGEAPSWELPLVGAGDAGRVGAVVPDASRGLEQSVDVVVVAGDARSEPVRVAVVDTPQVLVREVRYDYAPYTGRGPETVQWQGDLRAPEFTRVTIVAESNGPLEAAWIDPGCTGRDSDKKGMRIGQHDLSRAVGEFPLQMNAERTGPEFASYRLVFQPRGPAGGREQPIVDKLEHRVEVIADVAPEVTIEAPAEGIAVPPSAPVAIVVRAVDPDFGLARVGIEMRVQGGAEHPPLWLLERPVTGVFTAVREIVPERLGAGPGFVLEYRAVAIDTRPERPNETRSPWRALRIDPAAPPPPPPPAPPGGGDAMPPAEQGDPAAGPPGGGDGGEPQDGERDPADTADGDSERQKGGPGAGQDEPREAPAAGPQQGGPDGREQDAAGADADEGGRDGDARRQDAPRPEGGKPEGGKPEGGDQQGGKPEGGEQEGGGQEGRKPDGGRQQGDADSRPGRAGDRADDGRRAGPANPVAADGTNDGEAMERILQHRREKQQADGEAGRRDEGQRQGEGADRPRQAEGQRDEGEQRPREAGDPRERDEGGEKERPRRPEDAGQRPPCADADGKPCGKEGCSSCKGGGKSGGSGEGQSGEGKPGEGKPGEGKPGEGKPGEAREKPNDQGTGGDKPGQGEPREDGQQPSGEPQGDGRQPRQEASECPSCAGPDGKPCGKKGCSSCSGGGASGGGSGQGQSGQGKPGDGKAGEGKPGEGKPGEGKPGEGDEKAAGELPAGAQPAPGSDVGTGGRAGGDRGNAPGAQAADAGPRRDAEWTAEDTTHARNAADLALEHLRDSVNSGRDELLQELGWTPEQARAFIERWESMRRLADSADRDDRAEFEQVIRSLGLRPDGVGSARDVPAATKGGQAEGRRSRPPAAYREQFEAFLRGTGG